MLDETQIQDAIDIATFVRANEESIGHKGSAQWLAATAVILGARWPIDTIERLQLGPDDILVVRGARPISADHAHAIRDRLSAAIGDRKILVIDDGMSLEVLAESQHE